MTNSVLGKRGYGEQGEKGDKGDQGSPGFTSSLLEYIADASQNNSGNTGPNPTNPIQSGRIRFNNSSHKDSTALIFSSFDRFGRDIDRVLRLIPAGSFITIQRQTTSEQFATFQVGFPWVGTDDKFASISVTPVESLGANFGTNDLVYALVTYAGAPGEQGPPGSTGSTGPQGPPGSTGPQGESFTYKGIWSQSTTYVKNDVVYFNGYSSGTTYAGTYVCTATLVSGIYPPVGSWSPIAYSGTNGSTGATGPQGIQGEAGPQGNTGLTGATGAQGPQGIPGSTGATGTAATITLGSVSTGAAGSSVIITNSGTPSAATFNFTIPRGDTGATGPTGSSTEFEYTFSQASYYGTVPTFNFLNMPSGAVLNGGGSVTIGTNTGVNQLTKTYHVRSNTASVANGQSSGWVPASTFPFFFVGQGFKVTYSFGLLDTSTNATTRTMIGFGNFGSSFEVLSNTVSVQSVAKQFLGIIQESGESFFSFYSRGPSSGITPVVSTVACTTPNTGWYTVTFHNDANSNDVLITLKHVSGGVLTTATQTITCGASNTLQTSQACYPYLQRAMSSSGGTTGSAILAISGLKFYTR